MMMHVSLHSNFQKGQTLIEALTALAVGAIVLSAAAILTMNSLNTSQTSKNQNLATQYAQEGLELARRERLPRPSAATTYCVGETDEGLEVNTPCSVGNLQQGEYKREVTLSTNASTCGVNTYQVKSVVSWSDGKCSSSFCRNVTLTTCLAP